MRRHLCTLLLLVLTPCVLQAQQGRADLRYRAPLPNTVSYLTVDTMVNTIGGLPTGEMSVTMAVQTRISMGFRPAGDSVEVTATVHELTGAASTPMGDMPVSARDVPARTFWIRSSGVDVEQVMQQQAQTPPLVPGMDAGAMMAESKALVGLLFLPGREVALGEAWTDTLRMNPDLDGLRSEVVVINRGTYEADTVVDGIVLNVLRLSSDMSMKLSGAVQGMSMTQHMNTKEEERVLWDSAQHRVVHRDSSSELRSDTTMPDQGMTMAMTGRGRSITSIAPAQ